MVIWHSVQYAVRRLFLAPSVLHPVSISVSGLVWKRSQSASRLISMWSPSLVVFVAVRFPWSFLGSDLNSPSWCHSVDYSIRSVVIFHLVLLSYSIPFGLDRTWLASHLSSAFAGILEVWRILSALIISNHRVWSLVVLLVCLLIQL